MGIWMLVAVVHRHISTCLPFLGALTYIQAVQASFDTTISRLVMMCSEQSAQGSKDSTIGQQAIPRHRSADDP